MDDAVLERLRQKAAETGSNRAEVLELARLVAARLPGDDAGSETDRVRCVEAGIAAGRLYNAFYYQTRRLLQRNPTAKEFKEFADFVQSGVRLCDE